MPIYTKKGDKGKTVLANGKIVSKANIRVMTYGTVDELNSLLGVIISGIRVKNGMKTELLGIQDDLLEIASVLANPGAESIGLLGKRVKAFEISIDNMTMKMPPLRNFILPGGNRTASLFHLGRTVCRRAERDVVLLSQKERVDQNILIYLNRLSDLLFTMARFVNFKDKIKEEIWINK